MVATFLDNLDYSSIDREWVERVVEETKKLDPIGQEQVFKELVKERDNLPVSVLAFIAENSNVNKTLHTVLTAYLASRTVVDIVYKKNPSLMVGLLYSGRHSANTRLIEYAYLSGYFTDYDIPEFIRLKQKRNLEHPTWEDLAGRNPIWDALILTANPPAQVIEKLFNEGRPCPELIVRASNTPPHILEHFYIDMANKGTLSPEMVAILVEQAHVPPEIWVPLFYEKATKLNKNVRRRACETMSYEEQGELAVRVREYLVSTHSIDVKENLLLSDLLRIEIPGTTQK